MKYHIKLEKFSSVDEFPEYWSTEDLIELLTRFDYPDAETSSPQELRELLALAVTDFEPQEAAAIVLDYKLSNDLNEGQIEQISHEMLLDNIAEEYADISFHSRLFHINELLYKAYNGKFPHGKASIIDVNISTKHPEAEAVTKEVILKLLYPALSPRSVIKRLFHDQLESPKKFPEAQHILWGMEDNGENTYQIITSDYWLNKEDFTMGEFDAELPED